MGHGSNVFDGAIGHYQAMLGGKFLPLARGALDGCPQTHPVVWVSPRDHQLNGGPRSRLAFKYSIGLVGPVDFSAQWAPAKTPRAAQPLRLRQIHFASSQRLLGFLPFGSVADF